MTASSNDDDESIFIDGEDDQLDILPLKDVLLHQHHDDSLGDDEIGDVPDESDNGTVPSNSTQLNFSKIKTHAARKSLKCSLKDILDKNKDYTFLSNVIDRANYVIFITYHFIRAYVLYCYEQKEDIPRLTVEFVMMAIKCIAKSSSGPTPKRNATIRSSLDLFFKNQFVHLLYPDEQIDANDMEKYKLDTTNLSYILGASADEMRISYMNNIQLNFFKYLCQYVNQSYKKEHQTAIDNETGDKSELRKQLKAELRKVKDDLVYGTLKSEAKYHQWITDNRSKVLPTIGEKQHHETYIKQHEYNYLPYMLYMNKFLETNGLKMFQPISLRTEFRNKYITFNTSAIVDILPNLANKNLFNKNIASMQDEIWSLIFDIQRLKRKYKLNGYSFNYQIHTDGVGMSINFIHNSEIPKKKQKAAALRKGRDVAKSKYKSMTRDQIDAAKKKSEDDKKQRALESANKYKEVAKQKREEFKKLSVEEQQLITLKNKLERDEFNYIEDLVKCADFLEYLRQAHKDHRLTYIDPGKRSLMYMLGDNGYFFNYTNSMKLRGTKQIDRLAKIDRRKEGTDVEEGLSIKDAEAILSLFSHKTVVYDKFCEYLTMKLLVRSCIMQNTKFNDYLITQHWHSYIDKRRHEDKLLNKIGRIYGEDAIHIIGDWGNKGRVSYMSTPGVGLKRLLSKRFPVYHIDEYLTSKLSHKTHEECGKLKMVFNNNKKKGGKVTKRMHSVLTYEMSNRRLGCINRDKNAVNNFKYIVEQVLVNGKRPEAFSRKK